MTSLPYVPDDILYTIAIHTTYSHTLALLAARPTNGILLRALYDDQSDLWHRRLGSHTGRGCLVDATTGLPTKSAPWSYKMQHDALVPREGNLILSGLPISATEPAPAWNGGLWTNVRVRNVVCASRIGHGYRGEHNKHGTTAQAITSRYLIVTEEGELQYSVDRDDALIVRGWQEEHRAMAEDRASWRSPFFRQVGGDILLDDPRMKIMIECDGHVICLDYEGRLWIIPNIYIINFWRTQPVRAIEVALPSCLASEGPVLAISQITYTNPQVANPQLSHAILLTLSGSTRECTLFLHCMMMRETVRL